MNEDIIQLLQLLNSNKFIHQMTALQFEIFFFKGAIHKCINCSIIL